MKTLCGRDLLERLEELRDEHETLKQDLEDAEEEDRQDAEEKLKEWEAENEDELKELESIEDDITKRLHAHPGRRFYGLLQRAPDRLRRPSEGAALVHRKQYRLGRRSRRP